MQWQKTLGSKDYDAAHCVVQAADGSYVIAGGASAANGDVSGLHGSYDGWVVKLSGSGMLQWQKTYGGSSVDDINYIRQTTDGGFIMTGYTVSNDGDAGAIHGGADLWVVKIDGQGNLQWQKTLGGTDTDAGQKVIQTTDGGYMVAGITKSVDGDVHGNHGDFDYWVVKLSAGGNLQWQKCYGGTAMDVATGIQPTPDGGCIIGGNAASADGDVTGNHGGLDYWVVRISATGSILWQQCYGGNNDDRMGSIITTEDGWFMAAGATMSTSGDVAGLHGYSHDFWAVKLGPDLRCLPVVSIAASKNNICMGTGVTFTATVKNEGVNGVFKWKRNGTVVGSNAVAYLNDVRHKDVISCSYSCKTPCGRDTTVISENIVMNVINDIVPEIAITASDALVCEGAAITCNATSFYGEMVPAYQWQVNGTVVGTNSAVFASASLPNGAQVRCIMTVSSPSCIGTTKALSNILAINTKPVVAPGVTIAASATSICKGGSLTFTATTNGGPHATYQWKVNGRDAGANSPTFITTGLTDGAITSCVVQTDPAQKCLTGAIAFSNTIQVSVREMVTPSVQIRLSENSVCAETPVRCTAIQEHAGTTQAFQWQLNQVNTGASLPEYTSKTFKDGDKIRCVLTTDNAVCPGMFSVVSNEETIRVKAVPVISFDPAEVAIDAGATARLQAVVTGAVSHFEWSPATLLANSLTLQPVTTALFANTPFTLNVKDANGCQARQELLVKVFTRLYMPNAFTPNGDGKNDVFRIPAGVSLKLTEFAVFNRWGNKVFASADVSKGWDGTYRGHLLDAGIYIYMITGENEKGAVRLKGSLLLVR